MQKKRACVKMCRSSETAERRVTSSLWRSEESFFFFQAEDGIRDYKVTSSDVCSSDLGPVSLSYAVLLGSQLRDRFGVFPVGWHSRCSLLCCIEDRTGSSTVQSPPAIETMPRGSTLEIGRASCRERV